MGSEREQTQAGLRMTPEELKAAMDLQKPAEDKPRKSRIDPEQPAFPALHIHHFDTDADGQNQSAVVPRWMGGLTKREYFAAVALIARSLVPNPRMISDYAREAVEMADALIAELQK